MRRDGPVLEGGAQLADQKIFVRLSGELLDEVAERARADQLPMATVVKLLVWRGLHRQPEAPLLDSGAPDLAALATLVCAEQVLQLLQSALPEGRRDELEQRANAAAAAERRLREIREAQQ